MDAQAGIVRRRHRGSSAKPAQRGNMTVTFMLLMLGLVSILGLVEVGYLFWAKRDLQKTADLAALAGAQRIELCTNVGNEAARTSAEVDNKLPALDAGGAASHLMIQCGHWTAPAADLGATCDLAQLPFAAGEEEPDAVLVVTRRSVVPFFGMIGPIAPLEACAVARSGAPRASFSVGSALAGLDWENDSQPVLAPLLRGLGLDLDGTALIGYNGLANARVTPSGLLEQLGIPLAVDADVGTINALLAAQKVRLGDVLNAVATLADQQQLLGLNADLLAAIAARTGIQDLQVQLGSDANGSGLFAAIVAPEGGAASALGVGVNALDLVYAAIGAATQKHALQVKSLDLIPGLGLVEAKVAVVEPPSIAIGGIGATAYTAQVRTYLKVGTSNVPLIGSLVNLSLPIMIDTVAGRGTITDMCSVELRDAQGRDRARIDVTGEVLKVCVGRPGANPAQEDQIFSTVASCDQQLSNAQLLRVQVLGANLAALNTHFAIDALPTQGEVLLAQGDSGRIGNPVALGDTVQAVTDAVLAALLVNSVKGTGTPPTAAQRQAMAQALWDKYGSCSSASCRSAQLKRIDSEIRAASQGLSGFLGNLTGNTLAILDRLLSLDLARLLDGVGNLVGGLLGSLGSVLGDVLGGLLGNPCTGGGLFGGSGTDAGCVNKIAESLQSNSSGGGQSAPNSLIALAGFLTGLLQPILDGVGTALTGLLQNALGLQLGQVDVHLASLDCQHGAQLVH